MRKLGEGDLKLSIICALPLSSVFQLMQAVATTWFIGGVFALFKPRTSIAFARLKCTANLNKRPNFFEILRAE